MDCLIHFKEINILGGFIDNILSIKGLLSGQDSLLSKIPSLNYDFCNTQELAYGRYQTRSKRLFVAKFLNWKK